MSLPVTDPYSAPYFKARSAITSPISESERSIGPYSIIKPLGSGGLGQTYLARRSVPENGEIGGLVVLKELRLISQHDYIKRSRLFDEALVLLAIDDASLVRILDVLSLHDGTSQHLVIVMEHCEGGTLSDRLNDKRSISFDEAVHHLLEIAFALSRLHAFGRVHCDVKPSNIWFAREFENWYLKLGDFDLSATIRETGERRFRGTPEYAAPEQFAGDFASQAADIWAWGRIALQFFGAEGNQFGLSADFDISDDQLSGRQEVDCSLPEGLVRGRHAWLGELVRRALSRHPSARPTADQIVAAFRPRCSFTTKGQLVVGQDPGRAQYQFCFSTLAARLQGLGWETKGEHTTIRVKTGTLALERARLFINAKDPIDTTNPGYSPANFASLSAALRLLDTFLGDPMIEGAVANQLLSDPSCDSIAVGFISVGDHRSPLNLSSTLAHEAISLKFRCLVELVYEFALEDHILGLQAWLKTWEEVPILSLSSLVHRAQGYLLDGQPYRALSALVEHFDSPHAAQTMKLIFVAIGDFYRAYEVGSFLLDLEQEERSIISQAMTLLDLYEYDAESFLEAALRLLTTGLVPDIVVAALISTLSRADLPIPVPLSSMWSDLKTRFLKLRRGQIREAYLILCAGWYLGDCDFVAESARELLHRRVTLLPIHVPFANVLRELSSGHEPSRAGDFYHKI